MKQVINGQRYYDHENKPLDKWQRISSKNGTVHQAGLAAKVFDPGEGITDGCQGLMPEWSALLYPGGEKCLINHHTFPGYYVMFSNRIALFLFSN
jgi:hypothetical protein